MVITTQRLPFIRLIPISSPHCQSALKYLYKSQVSSSNSGQCRTSTFQCHVIVNCWGYGQEVERPGQREFLFKTLPYLSRVYKRIYQVTFASIFCSLRTLHGLFHKIQCKISLTMGLLHCQMIGCNCITKIHTRHFLDDTSYVCTYWTI